jgi:hypothetical protein
VLHAQEYAEDVRVVDGPEVFDGGVLDGPVSPSTPALFTAASSRPNLSTVLSTRLRPSGITADLGSVRSSHDMKLIANHLLENDFPSCGHTLEAWDRSSYDICAARELGPLGIRVNGVRPGVVLTDAVRTQLAEKSVAAGLRQTYLGRLGTPEDIAQAVAFLASDNASWVTGQMLNVCGGLSVHGGASYEGLARMLFGDDAIDDLQPSGSSPTP